MIKNTKMMKIIKKTKKFKMKAKKKPINKIEIKVEIVLKVWDQKVKAIKKKRKNKKS